MDKRVRDGMYFPVIDLYNFFLCFILNWPLGSKSWIKMGQSHSCKENLSPDVSLLSLIYLYFLSGIEQEDGQQLVSGLGEQLLCLKISNIYGDQPGSFNFKLLDPIVSIKMSFSLMKQHAWSADSYHLSMVGLMGFCRNTMFSFLHRKTTSLM